MADRRGTLSDPPSHPGRVGLPRAGVLLAAVTVLAVTAVLLIASWQLGGEGSPGAATGTGATPAWADLSLVPVSAAPSVAGVTSRPGTTASTGLDSAVPTSAATGSGPATAEGVRAKRIRVERLGIDLRIVEGDGVDAPIGKAAHYPGSAWPGEDSNIYLYGHAREGMFLALWDARDGDVIELDLVDGTTRRYIVDQVLPKVPWNAVKYLRPTNGEQLTLQTSTSYFATAPRFIVIAYPAP